MFYNLNLVFCFVILQRTVNFQINNSKSFMVINKEAEATDNAFWEW